MLKNMKIKTKIILVPALAAVGFLLIFIINTFLGSQNNQLLVSIEEGYFPALEISRELEDILETTQRNMQYAVSAMDEEVLIESDQLRDKFDELINKGRENPILKGSSLDSLKSDFQSYYGLAKHTSLQMINVGFGEEVIENLDIMQQKFNQIQEKLSLLTSQKKSDLANSVADAQSNQQSILLFIIIVTVLSIILQVLVSIFFTRSITSPLQNIVHASRELSYGNVNVELHSDSDDEMGELAKTTSVLVDTTKNLAKAADAIGQGKYDVDIDIRGESDILGQAIVRMKNNLLKMTNENDTQNWLKSGQAELSDKMRGDQSVIDLAQNILNYTASYLNAQIGAIYLKDESDDYKLSGSYAFKKRKNLSNNYKAGEGLVGQAVLEKKSILITDVPDDYIKINSGVGEGTPLNILVTPFIYNNEAKGVIELGSFQEFSDIELTFLEQVAENIAIAFNSAEARIQMGQLLQETQKQAKELQEQQEELRAANEELQSQQEELRTANEELEEQTEALKSSEEILRSQQDELKNSNSALEIQKEEVETKNEELEIIRIQVERKADELEQISKYKSEFLANMSHELRTPLNSIQILSRLLAENKESNLTEKQIGFARTINNSGEDLLGLINEILDLSKIEAGKMILNVEDISLAGLSSYMEQNFNHLAEEKNLYFKVELGNDLPKSISSDRQRLEQIIKNLVSNAMKFTETGGIKVEITKPDEKIDLSQSGLRAADAVCISVADSGVGIPAEKLKLIFEAFQQADGTTSRKYGGTGLGLSISRELANLLQGELQVASDAGKGSIFSIYIPEKIMVDNHDVAKGTSDITDTDLSVKVQTLPAVEETVVKKKVNEIRDDRLDIEGNNKSILIIEDDPSFAKILFDFIREKGYKCIIAEDGEAGLQMATQYKPDSIILDVGLPRIDGWTVMERLKSDVGTRHIPVYFISAHDRKIDAMRMGAIGYLTKPVSMDNLDLAFSKIDKTISKNIKNLLVVEDDKVMRDSILELLDSEGIKIDATDKGEKALTQLHSREYDCMVLDLGLSDISGYDLIDRIKTDDKISDLPIIIYTGKELNKKQENQLKKYAESIIIKGAKSPDRLLDEVSLFLHKVESTVQNVDKSPVETGYDLSFKDKNILLVDDDIRNIYALSSVLEEKDIEVITAENGKEALNRLSENSKVDLVLMDIMMPEMNGYETMVEIRKEKKFRDLPIIALTAKAMKGDRQKCLEAGASDYLSKPVDIEKLLSLLHVWLHKS